MKALKLFKGFFYFQTMIRLIYVLAIVLLLPLVSCNGSLSTVDKRKQKLERKKRRHPHDCPKIDC